MLLPVRHCPRRIQPEKCPNTWPGLCRQALTKRSFPLKKKRKEKILVFIGLTLKVEKLKYPHDNCSVSFNDGELSTRLDHGETTSAFVFSFFFLTKRVFCS